MSARFPWSSRLREDQGSATAETAIVLPVVVLMVVVILVIGTGVGTQLRLESAARGAARELARGEDEGTARSVARRIGGDEVQVSVAVDGTWVHVEATRALRIEDGALAGASWELSADATARREPHLIEGGAP